MSLKISEYLDKNNLHHAYLIEGMRDEIVPEILEYIQSIGIKTSGNPDFCHISVDFLRIKQAMDLRSMGTEKGFTSGRKIFLICVNRFSPDAQGVLLKMFEEPIENTHFFIITPDINVLAKTLISRFYLIKTKTNFENELKEAEKFITMPLRNRIDFIKEFITLSEKSDEDDEEIIEEPARPHEGAGGNSVRSKAFRFLDALEYTLHQKTLSRFNLDSKVSFFDQIFKAREFLRQQGSPTKTLLESIALAIPIF